MIAKKPKEFSNSDIVVTCANEALDSYIKEMLDNKETMLKNAKTDKERRGMSYFISMIESYKENELCANAIGSIFISAFGSGYYNYKTINDLIKQNQNDDDNEL